MKKLLTVILGLLLIFVLSACSDGKKDENYSFVTNSELANYVNMSKDLSSNIYKDSSFDSLQNVFNSHRDKISPELFSKKFDTSKLEVQNSFVFLYEILTSEIAEVFVEKLEDEQLVNVVIVNKLGVDLGYEDEHVMHGSEQFYVTVVDVYRFKDGNLISYESHR